MINPLIMNRERFDQQANFNTFMSQGTDIDFTVNLRDKLQIIAEFKAGSAMPPFGQGTTLKQIATHMGKSIPCFYILCHHNTRPDEDITGENLLVSLVHTSTPRMNGKIEIHEFTDRPTLNQFISDAFLTFLAPQKYYRKIPHFMVNEECNQFWAKPEVAYILKESLEEDREEWEKHLAEIFKDSVMLEKFAACESVDWDDLPSDLKVWLTDLGYGNDWAVMVFYNQIFIPWVATQFPEEASVAA